VMFDIMPPPDHGSMFPFEKIMLDEYSKSAAAHLPPK
jgi:hypothetical protein